jgi:flagellar basal body-associated protein FliL
MIIIIVLTVVLGLIIIGIILYFVYLYPKTRKKRAQELDDNYEYKSKEEPKEKLVADDKEE